METTIRATLFLTAVVVGRAAGAEPPREPTHRVVVVSAEVAASKATGDVLLVQELDMDASEHDIVMLPTVTLTVGGVFSQFTPELPPRPPDTVQIDDVHFVTAKGRQAAVKHVDAYLNQFNGLPPFPDGMPRARSFAMIARHDVAADAERAAKQLRDRLEALRGRR